MAGSCAGPTHSPRRVPWPTRSADTEALVERGEVPGWLIIVGDLILTEVLQGFRRDRDFNRARRLFASFPTATMVGPRLALRAAENYRGLRRLGVAVRKTIDVMIATCCIARRLPLLHADTDFEPMVRHLGLRVP